jgi:tetratricopeptide (TPR) repeat protein
MDNTQGHSRSYERKMLSSIEQNRTERSRRDLFWADGSRWNNAFQQLVERENASDTAFRRQIDELLPGDTQVGLEERFFNAVHDDIDWWSRFAAELENAEHAVAAQDELDELTKHQFMVAWRLLERQVVRCQVQLEILERRRRQGGRLQRGQWREQWNELHRLIAQQSACYKQLPSQTTQRMLAWCRRLYAMQTETRASWQHTQDVDRSSLEHAMRDVAALMARLDPPEQSESGIGGWIAVALILGVIVALANGGSSSGGTAVSGTAQTATAPAITGHAVPTAQAASSGPSSPADQQRLYDEGMTFLKQGDCKEAIARFQAAYDADPASGSAYESLDNIAFCLYEQGKTDEAIAKWRQAQALEPNSPDVNAGLGMALYASGQQAEGLALYRKAISIQPRYADEAFLRDGVFWSEKAIADSRDVRAAARQ